MRRLVLLACFALVSVLVSPVLTSSQAAANNDAAHACQQGGYASLARADGTSFKNAGECTSYAARGGEIVGVGPACVVAANSGCIVLNAVTIQAGDLGPPFTYSTPTTTITLSGVMTFTPTCDIFAANCSYATITIAGSGTFSTSTGVTGTWTASYASPDPYGFQNADTSASACPGAPIKMVTSRLALSWSGGSGGAWVEVRTDTTASGPNKNFVLANFYSAGLPSGYFHTSDMSDVTLAC